MPEGDSIWKAAAALRPLLVGRPVEQVLINQQLGVRGRGEVAPRWSEATVDRIETLGKHLFIHWTPTPRGEGPPVPREESESVLRVHLGLHGSWHRYPPGHSWQKGRDRAALELRFADVVVVCFNAEVESMTSREAEAFPRRRRLGQDVLAPDFDAERALERAKALLPADATVCDLLLDQRVACGIGNVYKSEGLFLQRIAPDRVASDVADGELVTLLGRTAGLLRRNLEAGPRRTTAEGAAERLWVYGRSRRPCLECRATVRFRRMGRSWRDTYDCPQCQR